MKLNNSLELTIKNRLGLHARAAAKLVKVADKYNSEINLIKDDKKVDVKSVLAILSLGCTYDSTVKLEAIGTDSKEALNAIKNLFESYFGEE